MKQFKEFLEVMMIRLILLLLVEAVFTAYDKARTGRINIKKYLRTAIRLMDNMEDMDE